jgi:hypothetical protein
VKLFRELLEIVNKLEKKRCCYELSELIFGKNRRFLAENIMLIVKSELMKKEEIKFIFNKKIFIFKNLYWLKFRCGFLHLDLGS